MLQRNPGLDSDSDSNHNLKPLTPFTPSTPPGLKERMVWLQPLTPSTPSTPPGLKERMVWLGAKIEDDSFGSRLLTAGVDNELVKEWMDNAIVNTPDGQ